MGVPIVLCPLEVERRAIAKAVGLRARVLVCGPGARAITRAMDSLDGDKPPLVVLCGLAGGVAESLLAPRIGSVLDKDARSYTVPVVPPGSDVEVVLLGLDEPVLRRHRKEAIASAYGATLVDCESHAFAAAAERLGLRWSIVRGVSDGPTQSLHECVPGWVDSRGRARRGRILLDAIVHPSIIPSIVRLWMRSRSALKVAAGRLIELLHAEQRLRLGERGLPPAVLPKRAAAAPGPTVIEQQLGRSAAPTAAAPPDAGAQKRSRQ